MQLTYAIPYYKGLPYLKKTLQSLLAQVNSNWQAIVVDDCSPEPGSEDLVRSFGSNKVRYYRNEKGLGLAGNWNRCLSLVETPLATILHADDELLPNYTDLMIAAATAYPDASAFFCAARIIDQNGNPAFSFPDFVKKYLIPTSKKEFRLRGESGVRSLLKGNFIMCPTICYRMGDLGEERFVESRKFVTDLDFTIRLLLQGKTLVGLPDIAYSYRRHKSNATSIYTENLLRFNEEVDIYNELSKVLRQRQWHQAAAIADNKRIIKLNLLYCILKDLVKLQPRHARQKARFLANHLL